MKSKQDNATSQPGEVRSSEGLGSACNFGERAMTDHELLKAAKKKPGRPELPPDERRDCIVRARVTGAEAAKWERLGGAEWLRRVLARAKET